MFCGVRHLEANEEGEDDDDPVTFHMDCKSLASGFENSHSATSGASPLAEVWRALYFEEFSAWQLVKVKACVSDESLIEIARRHMRGYQ